MYIPTINNRSRLAKMSPSKNMRKGCTIVEYPTYGAYLAIKAMIVESFVKKEPKFFNIPEDN